MTDRQENLLSMIQNVYDSCTAFTTVWQGHLAFSAAFTDFGLARNNILNAALEQGKFSKGIRAFKLQKRDELADFTLVFAKAIHAYAISVGDLPLAGLVDITKSDLQRARDGQLESICRRIMDEAANLVALVPAFANYGVTAVMVDNLEIKLLEYISVMTKPRQAIGMRATATENLKLHFASAIQILKDRMDTLVIQYRTSYPEFYDQYVRMRMILDYGTGTGSTAEPEPIPLPAA